jgi:NAD(P)-dependent dehydrogenase (short-subunit alcohol dehydrogenase family)
MRLTGKVTLITNVSQFMGPACVEEFAKEGATLVLHDKSEARAQPAIDVARAYGRDLEAVAGDLTLPREADRVVRAAVDRFGRLDVLVNNSSHPPVGGPVEETSDETWRAMLAHLLDEPFYCLRAALRIMKRQGHGKIVNLSSAAAIPGLPNYAAYSAARAGTNGLTRAVGREVARHGIQVNAIAPGWFVTEMNEEAFADPRIHERLVRDVPARRTGRLEEIGPLAVYLASPASDFMIGQTIFLDGGHSAG